MSSLACCRDPASPRRTNSASSRCRRLMDRRPVPAAWRGAPPRIRRYDHAAQATVALRDVRVRPIARRRSRSYLKCLLDTEKRARAINYFPRESDGASVPLEDRSAVNPDTLVDDMTRGATATRLGAVVFHRGMRFEDAAQIGPDVIGTIAGSHQCVDVAHAGGDG